ncbi:MAG: hypothetical protein WC750_06530 [Patescibacteria group bacterium]|jgi:hypothetical protein
MENFNQQPTKENDPERFQERLKDVAMRLGAYLKVEKDGFEMILDEVRVEIKPGISGRTLNASVIKNGNIVARILGASPTDLKEVIQGHL